MRNDTLLKVTCITNNGLDEFHFDYYNKENQFVGTIIVNEKGKLEWYIFNRNNDDKVFILNEGIENNILNTVSYIYGEKEENNIDFVNSAKIDNYDRWNRAQEFINSRGLYVNYKQNKYFNEEFNKTR